MTYRGCLETESKKRARKESDSRNQSPANAIANYKIFLSFVSSSRARICQKAYYFPNDFQDCLQPGFSFELKSKHYTMIIHRIEYIFDLSYNDTLIDYIQIDIHYIQFRRNRVTQSMLS